MSEVSVWIFDTATGPPTWLVKGNLLLLHRDLVNHALKQGARSPFKGNRAHAEDLASDALIAVLENIAGEPCNRRMPDGVIDVLAWAKSVINSKINNYQRRRTVRYAVPFDEARHQMADGATAEAEIIEREADRARQATVQAIRARLSADPLALSIFEDIENDAWKSQAAFAAKINVPVSAVKAAWQRVRRVRIAMVEKSND